MRPNIIRIGSIFSIIGAFIALALFGIDVSEGGNMNIANMLSLILIAVLFFVTAGFFYEGGIGKSQGIALAMIGITTAVIISVFILVKDTISIQGLICLLICIAVTAIAATTEESNRWFRVESS